MKDHTRDLENLNELKFTREQGFLDKSKGVGIALALTLVFVLFLTLHFREVRVEILEIDTIASRYVVAQVDYEFLDEEATIILKSEAVRDIGKIYKLAGKDVYQNRADFESAFIASGQWRKPGQGGFEEMSNALDQLEKTLQRSRFTDPRTLQKIRQLNFKSYDYFIYTPLNLKEPAQFPKEVWNEIFVKAFVGGGISEQARTSIEKAFVGGNWKLEDDIPSQRLIRHRLQSEVPAKYTHVSAGSRVIDQGEKVTMRHMAMMQAMKKVLREERNLWHPMTLSGSLILSLLLTTLGVAYFRINHPLVLESNRKVILLLSVLIMTMAAAKFTEYFTLTAKTNLIEYIHYPIFVPFAAIMLSSLMSPSIASFSSVFLAIVLMLSLAFERQGFLLINIATAFCVIFTTRTLRRRKEVFVVCGKGWLCAVAVIISLHLYQSTDWSTGIVLHTVSSALFMLVTAVVVVGLLPLFESSFGIMTDVTLMEYMDPNNDLLRRLSIEAPGTYQHSVLVGNIAESAASAIGANGLFCRVATLYHDIGKIATPQYFTENQQGGMNIHQLLTPQESAQVIMAHVSEGVSMARKSGLPEQFIDVIKEHHGTTLVFYFYQKQVEKMGGDPQLVDEREFRYAGPTPRTKESGIIMIADTIEAASRSLDKVEETVLNEMATRLIREKVEDGQLDHCLLTFEELATVKATLIKTLVACYGRRVKYPNRTNASKEPLVYNG